jgi:hypothetical protein
MRQPIRNIAVLLILLKATLFSSHRVALAENIDPQDIGLKYAWGKNIGWVNVAAVTTSWRPFPPIPTMNASGIMIFAVFYASLRSIIRED